MLPSSARPAWANSSDGSNGESHTEILPKSQLQGRPRHRLSGKRPNPGGEYHAKLIIPFSNLDDRIAALCYSDSKQNRTAADGAVLGETLPRAGRRIDANVVLLSAIRAHVGRIVFKRHGSPYVRETRVHDDSTLPGCRSATRSLLEVACEPGIDIARLGFADFACYRVRVRFKLGAVLLRFLQLAAATKAGRYFRSRCFSGLP